MNGQLKLREYKYLVNSGIKYLKPRASSAHSQIKRKLGENVRECPDITMGLFNALAIYGRFMGLLKTSKKQPS